MQRASLLVLAAIVAVALAAGQYYVPRSYYVIDAEGHASAPVPLRRLRRSVDPYPYMPSGSSTANANANAQCLKWFYLLCQRSRVRGPLEAFICVMSANVCTPVMGNAQAKAIATSNTYPARVGGEGEWNVPRYTYGSANPKALSAGQTRRQNGPVLDGRSVSASTSVGIDSTGKGYYDQSTSVSD